MVLDFFFKAKQTKKITDKKNSACVLSCFLGSVLKLGYKYL